jgi:hypothetical protein
LFKAKFRLDVQLVLASTMLWRSLLPTFLNILGLSLTFASVRSDPAFGGDTAVNLHVLAETGLAKKRSLHHMLGEWSAVSMAFVVFLISLLHYKRFGDATASIDSLKLVMMTSISSLKDLEYLRNMGVSACFPKPETEHYIKGSKQESINDALKFEGDMGRQYSPCRLLLVGDN